MPGTDASTASRRRGRIIRGVPDLGRQAAEEAHEVQLIGRLADLDEQLGDAMAPADAADDGARRLGEAARDPHADEPLHVRMGEVADGGEGAVPDLGAGGDDLERRVHDLDLDVHVVHLVLEDRLDQEAIAFDADRC